MFLADQVGRPVFLFHLIIVFGALVSCAGEPMEPTEGPPPPFASKPSGGSTVVPPPTDFPALEPTSTPDADELREPSQLELLEELGARVQSIRGISVMEGEINFTPLTRDEFKNRIEEDLSDDDATEDLQVAEMFYKMLGLLNEEDSLKDVYQSFLGGGVLGFYDPETKEFTVIQEDSGQSRWTSIDETTFVHEYVHLLQDSSFSLKDIPPDGSTSDYALAVTALIEGDARSLETDYEERFVRGTTGYLFPYAEPRPPDPEIVEAIFSTPPMILFIEIAPYEYGEEFVTLLKESGGYEAVNMAIQDPPDSTEQVLNFESYQADEQAEDVYIDPGIFGDGWTVRDEDTLGQLFISGWVNVYNGATLRRSNLLFRIPETVLGWNGDYLVLSESTSGEWAMAGLIAWDTYREANEFITVLNRGLQRIAFFRNVAGTDSDVYLWRGPAGVLALHTFEHHEYGPVSSYVVSPTANGAEEILGRLK